VGVIGADARCSSGAVTKTGTGRTLASAPEALVAGFMGASTLARDGVLFLDRYEAFADLGVTPDTGT
jgi:hypothetical protein